MKTLSSALLWLVITTPTLAHASVEEDLKLCIELVQQNNKTSPGNFLDKEPNPQNSIRECMKSKGKNMKKGAQNEREPKSYETPWYRLLF